MMKIILMILLSTCLSLATAEYPRFKRKGVPQNGPHRPPPPPQFGKKWGKPPQKMPPQFSQNRPYQGPPPPSRRGPPPKPQMYTIPGFNMHKVQHMQHPMHNGPKFQQLPQPQKGPPTSMKDFFKTAVQQHHKIQNIPAISGQIIQFPQENKIVPKIIHQQEKPSFISSPTIPTAIEYDYHVQTNSIPMNVNTIKQVGEKGPIHTIPAPHLTPADKPSNLDLRKPQHYHQQQEFRFQPPQYVNEQSQQQIQHQYQVTEHNEQSSKQLFPRDQVNSQTTHYNPTSQVANLGNQQVNQYENQQLGRYENQQADNAQAYQNVQSVFYGQNNLGVTLQETGNHGINIGFGQTQSDQSDQEDMLLSNSKHYQVVNAPFSNRQQTQAIQSSFDQQQPQILSQYVQQEPEFRQQYQQENFQIAEDKNLNVEPEYHSFNYDEQAHQAQAKSGQSSGLVTATYSLGGSAEIVKGQSINSRSSSVDPLTQAQIVQSYFDTRSGNDVEPDAKPSASGNIEKEVLNTSFYSSLPSKEAAERLAKLQAAGKVNSNLMQLANKNRDQKSKDDATSDEKEYVDDKEDSVEYDEYSQEDESAQSDEKSGFGQKTRF